MEREYHLKSNQDGSFDVFSSFSNRYSGYAMGWHASSDARGVIAYRLYSDGTYDKLDQPFHQEYDPISGRIVKGKNPLDAAVKHLNQRLGEHNSIGSDVPYKLEFKTPKGKTVEHIIDRHTTQYGIEVKDKESALELGQKIARQKHYVDVKVVPIYWQEHPGNQTTLKGGFCWHEEAKKRMGITMTKESESPKPNMIGNVYEMTYQNSKGKTKTYAFPDGAKHGDITVNDLASAEEYAKRTATSWGVELQSATLKYSNLGEALDQLEQNDEKSL